MQTNRLNRRAVPAAALLLAGGYMAATDAHAASITIAGFTFENATAGGTALPRPSSVTGTTFPFSPDAAAANVNVGALVAMNNLGQSYAQVRTNTVSGHVPGGKFVELSPVRTEAPPANTLLGEPSSPSSSASTYAVFSVTPAAGYRIDFESISIDIGVAAGDGVSGGMTGRAKFFYSTDEVTWHALTGYGSAAVSSVVPGPSWSGWTTFSVDPGLEDTTGRMLLAVAFKDNSGLGLTSTPKGSYFDNLVVTGTVEAIPVTPPPAAVPLPTAALGGLSLFGVMGLKRRGTR